MAERSESCSSRHARLLMSFGEVKNRFAELGLQPENLNSVGSVKVLRKAGTKYRRRARICVYATLTTVAALIAMMLTIYWYDWPIGSRVVVKIFRPFTEPLLQNKRCIVPLSENNLYLIRSVADCGFCRNVTGIMRVANISADEFEERFVNSGQPVVVSDGQYNWVTDHELNYGRLQRMYTELEDSLMLDKSLSKASEGGTQLCELSRFAEGYKNPGDMFSHTPEDLNSTEVGKRWFMGWGNCDQRLQAELEKMFPLPYFFKTRKPNSRHWFHMSSRGYGSPYHIDGVDYVWQGQMQGRKYWYVQPPPECYFECPSYYFGGIVNPGEVVFLQAALWFHGTETIGNDFSIAISGKYDK